MTAVTDMMDNEIELISVPKRIVSVVPSQTELLYDLGLRDEVIGITKFCVHPQEWFRNKERVGGTKKLNIEKIIGLQPDIVIANKEENTKEDIDEISKHIPVWVSDISNINEALEMMERVSKIVDKVAEGRRLVADIYDGFQQLTTMNKMQRRTAYFIWYKPWMSVGRDTFIHDMMERVGFENVFSDMNRYPEISLDMLKDADPQTVLLSSEPFPFKEKHIAEIKAILPNANVKLVDGEMFSWYGSRMRKAIAYLQTLT